MTPTGPTARATPEQRRRAREMHGDGFSIGDNMKPIIWHNCYDQGWRGMIVPEAFAHPATRGAQSEGGNLTHNNTYPRRAPAHPRRSSSGGSSAGGFETLTRKVI